MSEPDPDDLYRRASAADRARPDAKVRARILAYAKRVAAQSATGRSARFSWRLLIPLAAAVVAALIFVPTREVPVAPPPPAEPTRVPPPALEPAPQPTPPAAEHPPAPLPSIPRQAPSPAATPPVSESGAAASDTTQMNSRSSLSASRLAAPARTGATRFTQAAASGSTEVLESLLKEDPTLVAAPDGHGRLPLTLATANHHLEAVLLLLAHGADPNAVDAEGRTPLEVAHDQGDSEIEAALRRAGAQDAH